MTRSKFRKLWLISLGIMLAVSMYAHNKNKETEKEISRKVRYVERLTVERRSGRQLNSALADLASRTIDENNSTRLDILRYLGLEESRLNITISNVVDKRIGKTTIATRTIKIFGELNYDEALNQLDYFYNTKKVSISFVKMSPVADVYDDTVNFTLGGTIYGLKKSK